MNDNDRKKLRSVFRKVHPDHFMQHAKQRHQNSESLKVCCYPRAGEVFVLMAIAHWNVALRQVLNAYVDSLADGRPPGRATLLFYVKAEGEQFQKIVAELPASGSLGPLLVAFGFFSEAGPESGGREVHDDTKFVEWLRDAVKSAMKRAEEHESTRQLVQVKSSGIQKKHDLSYLQVPRVPAVCTACMHGSCSHIHFLATCVSNFGVSCQ
jgi:hypothetical protein